VSQPPPPPLRIESLPTLEAARADWDSLALEDGNLFATYEWACAWWRHLAGDASPAIAACRRPDGSTAGLLPLATRRERGLRIAQLIGHGPSDRLAPICAPADRPPVADALRRHLTATGCDLFIGDQMPADEGWGRALGATTLEREQSPVLSIDGVDWDQFLAARSRNFRQQVRGRERKLAARGELRFRLSEDPERLDDDLRTLFDLHQARWQDGGSAAFAEPLREMHRDFAGAAQARGWLRLWLLELDGRPLAAWYGFRFADCEWFYQSGRSPEASAENVGFVLLAHTVHEAMNDGMREYRLLRGGEDYKRRFADRDPGLETVALPLSIRGRAALASRRLRPLASRALGRLRLR
jgi:CelD/BcsL family acetyltransferase involved in cellulose biosynthesis